MSQDVETGWICHTFFRSGIDPQPFPLIVQQCWYTRARRQDSFLCAKHFSASVCSEETRCPRFLKFFGWVISFSTHSSENFVRKKPLQSVQFWFRYIPSFRQKGYVVLITFRRFHWAWRCRLRYACSSVKKKSPFFWQLDSRKKTPIPVAMYVWDFKFYYRLGHIIFPIPHTAEKANTTKHH